MIDFIRLIYYQNNPRIGAAIVNKMWGGGISGRQIMTKFTPFITSHLLPIFFGYQLILCSEDDLNYVEKVKTSQVTFGYEAGF